MRIFLDTAVADTYEGSNCVDEGGKLTISVYMLHILDKVNIDEETIKLHNKLKSAWIL